MGVPLSGTEEEGGGWMIMKPQVHKILVLLEEINGGEEDSYEFEISPHLFMDLVKWCKWAEKYGGGVDDEEFPCCMTTHERRMK